MATAAVSLSQTLVKWEFKEQCPIIILLMRMKKMIGNDVKDGLNNLIVVLDQQHALVPKKNRNLLI